MTNPVNIAVDDGSDDVVIRGQASESLVRAVADLCDFGVCLADRQGEILLGNQTLASWLRSSPQPHWQGQTIWDLIPEAQRQMARDKIAAVVEGRAAVANFASYLLIGDAHTPCELQARLATSEPSTILAITIRRGSIETSQSHANASASGSRTDPLTGLPDRTYLMERLTSLISRAGFTKSTLALLFIDVDDFKQVNDRFGHLIGDQVLREVAQRLSSCVRAGDHVARFGGDEFVVMVGGIRGNIRPVSDRIRAAFARPFAMPDGELKLSVSIGIAETSPTLATADELLRAADQAMYAAKREKP
jgi:diguanylate cyclase (GGDEF)-like protein